jgi:hypothetical protein
MNGKFAWIELVGSQCSRKGSFMAAAAIQPVAAQGFRTTFVLAWVFCLFFYSMQYAVRSAPGVMSPELTTTGAALTASPLNFRKERIYGTRYITSATA